MVVLTNEGTTKEEKDIVIIEYIEEADIIVLITISTIDKY